MPRKKRGNEPAETFGFFGQPAQSDLYAGNYEANLSHGSNMGGNGSPYFGASGAYPTSSGSMNAIGRTGWFAAFGTGDDETPLLDELGINFGHIRQKTMTVLNPLKAVDSHIMDDSDLAGPILFCLMLGTALLLSGKPHFGYIYGVAFFGCVSLNLILCLMADISISFGRTASVLGYCLLPLCIPSFIGIVFKVDTVFGYALTICAITWCTLSASNMFIAALKMSEMKALVMYPVMLFYSVFAVLTVFATK